MSRAVCGVCFCPYGDEGDCACSTEAHYKKVIDDVQALFDAKREQPANANAGKPWVGLTDEERNWLRKRNQKHDDYAKAVEALLKEKNT